MNTKKTFKKSFSHWAGRGLLALALGSSAAQAAPIVAHDTLGPANAFNADEGWFGGSLGGLMNVAAADRFVSAADGWLDRATMALSVWSIGLPADKARIRVAVLADEGGKPGAAVDTAWVDIPLPASGATDAALFTIDFGRDAQLLAGASYWLSFTADEVAPSYQVIHAVNQLGLTGAHAFSGMPWQLPGTWSNPYDGNLGAVRIELDAQGRTVSEPAHAAFAALLAFAAVGRRRRAMQG